MNPDRWQQITEAFHVALDRDAAARAAYLDEACAGDPALRAEVDAMIAAHLRAGSFGKQPLGVPPGLNDAGSPGRCSHCGSPLLAEPGLPGMCPQCLLGLALQEPDASAARFHPGRIIGDRYQVLEALGHGGMGDVFKAFDLKLRVHVALKAIRADRAASERAREFLRSEVRSAREVVSPNVCRIFDLVAADEEEFVSMEYIDGLTLAERLRGLPTGAAARGTRNCLAVSCGTGGYPQGRTRASRPEARKHHDHDGRAGGRHGFRAGEHGNG